MTPALTARSFSTAVHLSMEASAATDDSVLLVHDDVAVQVDPGDDAATISANYDATVAELRARMTDMPRLSDRVREVREGDMIETLSDDHYTRVMRGAFGIVTHVEDAGQQQGGIVVRFAKRTVNYEPADFQVLRFAR